MPAYAMTRAEVGDGGAMAPGDGGGLEEKRISPPPSEAAATSAVAAAGAPIDADGVPASPPMDGDIPAVPPADGIPPPPDGAAINHRLRLMAFVRGRTDGPSLAVKKAPPVVFGPKPSTGIKMKDLYWSTAAGAVAHCARLPLCAGSERGFAWRIGNVTPVDDDCR